MIDDKIIRSVRLSGLESRKLSEPNHRWLRENFEKPDWDDFVYELYCRRKYRHRLVITNMSIAAAKNILRDLGVLVFPVAERCTTPYKDAGEWSWFMRDIRLTSWGSSYSLRETARRDVKLILMRYEDIHVERMAGV